MADEGRFVIDAHTHLYTGDLYTTEDRKDSYEESLEKNIKAFLEWLEKFNIKAAAASSLTPMIYRVWKTRHGGNEEIVALMKRAEGRIIGQYVPNVYEGPKAVKEKIEEAVKELGFKGLKIHPWVSGYPANAKIVWPVFEAATEYKLSVLIHSGTAPYTTPLSIADMARTFPEVPVIMGHMGKHELYHDTLPAARLSDNIYLETSGCYIQALFEKVVNELGAKRLLFGTDGPSYMLRAFAARIEDLDVTDEDKEWILGRSAAELFGFQKGV